MQQESEIEGFYSGQFSLEEGHVERRFDELLAHLFPKFSRTQWHKWIKGGFVQLDDKPCVKPSYRIRVQDRAVCFKVAAAQQETVWKGQSSALPLLFEDSSIIVVNKPAGWVVHPGAGNHEGTLINYLLGSYPQLEALPQAGLVHRLDKGTSGVMVIAKTLSAYTALVRAIQAREVKREYRALVWGQLGKVGVIDLPLGRHPVYKLKRAVRSITGKPAVSRFEELARWGKAAYLRLHLETGRTHQLRVHMSHESAPILGDLLYGGARSVQLPLEEGKVTVVWERPALHAYRLQFLHPEEKTMQRFLAPFPDDFLQFFNQVGLDPSRFQA